MGWPPVYYNSWNAVFKDSQRSTAVSILAANCIGFTLCRRARSQPTVSRISTRFRSGKYDYVLLFTGLSIAGLDFPNGSSFAIQQLRSVYSSATVWEHSNKDGHVGPGAPDSAQSQAFGLWGRRPQRWRLWQLESTNRHFSVRRI